MASQGDIRKFEQEQASVAAAANAPPPPSPMPDPSPTDPQQDGGKTVALGFQLPKIVTTSEAMDAASKSLIEESNRVQGEVKKLQPGIDQKRQALQGELDKPIPGAPKLNDVPQFQGKQLTQQEMLGFMGVAMAFAGIATKAIHGDMRMAFDAAAGALKGFNEGNIAQGKIEIENFKTRMDAVIRENQKMSEEYRGIMENRKLSLEQKTQALRVAASARDDEIMVSALRTNALRTVFDLEAHRINAGNQVAIHAAQIYNQAVAHADTLQTQKEIAKMRMDASEHGRKSGLSQDAVDNAAAFYILNGRMPVGMARIGQAAIEAIQNRAGEMTSKMGMTPQEFAAAGPIAKQKMGALLALEKQRNAIQSFEGMLDLNIDILKQLSAKVERTGSPYANKPILWLREHAQGDPDVAEYLFQVNTASTEIARILQNPNMTGQLTDTGRQEIQEVVSGNLNPQQLDRVLTRAQNDARNRSSMLDKQSEKVIKEFQNPLGRNKPASAAGVTLPSASDIDAELARRQAAR